MAAPRFLGRRGGAFPSGTTSGASEGEAQNVRVREGEWEAAKKELVRRGNEKSEENRKAFCCLQWRGQAGESRTRRMGRCRAGQGAAAPPCSACLSSALPLANPAGDSQHGVATAGDTACWRKASKTLLDADLERQEILREGQKPFSASPCAAVAAPSVSLPLPEKCCRHGQSRDAGVRDALRCAVQRRAAPVPPSAALAALLSGIWEENRIPASCLRRELSCEGTKALRVGKEGISFQK